MRKTILSSVLLIFILSFSASIRAQQYRLGGSLLYNFKTKGVGIGIRGEFPLEQVELLEGLSIVPQLSFFPSFNRITDFYIGSSVHLGVYKQRKWIFYALVNASYRAWRIEDPENNDSEYSNVAVEGGIGVTRNTCLRPFMELRLNVAGFEPNLRIGVLYTFNCDIKGAVPCPKIPAQPTWD